MPGQFESILDKLQRKLGKQTIRKASTIARPKPKFEVQQIKLFNEFAKRNPRAGGGLLNGSSEEAAAAAFRKKVEELMDDGYDFGEAVREAMRQGYQDGGRVGFYAGESVEPFLQRIKNLYLKGKTDREISKLIKKPRSAISRAITSMKNQTAPVKISKTELKNRILPPQSNVAKSKKITEKINKTYKKLKKELGKPPTKGQLAKAANVVPGTIRSNTPNLKFTSAASEGAKASTKNLKKEK